MARFIRWLMMGLCLSVCLAACAPQSQTATPASPASPPPAGSSVSASPPPAAPTGTPARGLPAEPLTATAESAAAPTPEAPASAAPMATPLIEPATAAVPPTPCVNDARFISDVTVPDGMQFLPGQLLNKKWSVENAGSCDWGANYRLVFISGDSLGAPSEVALYPARAGATATWEIPMVAPQTPGAYTSRWQARDPAGNLFGAIVFIKINVIPMPTAPSP